MVDQATGEAIDPDDIPELDDAFFERAEFKIGGVALASANGHPMAVEAVQQNAVKLEPAVLEGFRAMGPGWEGRVNDVLRAWLADHKSGDGSGSP